MYGYIQVIINSRNLCNTDAHLQCTDASLNTQKKAHKNAQHHFHAVDTPAPTGGAVMIQLRTAKVIADWQVNVIQTLVLFPFFLLPFLLPRLLGCKV